MRIELPSPTWADAQRAHDDAHTLTLPAQRALGLGDPLLGDHDDEEGFSLRVEVDLARPGTLTLTL